MKKRIVFMLFVLFPLFSSAEFVKWVDENGVAHYADSYANVPEQYLDTIESNKTVKAAGDQGEKSGTGLSPAVEVNPFILQGKLIDTNKRMQASLLDEGVEPSGKIDQIGLQVIIVTAWANNTILKTVHPDEDLGFDIFSDKRITHLTVDVSGCGFFYREDGPWDEDGDIAIDLGKGLFTIDGFVKNSDGSPAAKVLITAYDEKDTQITYRYTGSRGQFAFFTNQSVYTLRSAADSLQLKETGPWSGNATVILDVSGQDLFNLSGQVTDTNGNPVYNVFVYATNGSGSRIKTTRTDSNGKYTMEIDQRAITITANLFPSEDKTVISGPWQENATVNITLE